MPKMKSNRSASKRFHKTGTGKLIRHHAMKRHILTKKSRSRKRALGKSAEVTPGDEARMRRLLPYT